MIDLHCHLLPGIDDGPQTMQQSLALAAAASQNGISHAVVTPHIHPGRYENRAAGIAAACRQLQQALDDAAIPLQLGFSAEVRVSVELLDMVAAQEIPFYGEVDGYQLMLLEFPHSHVLPGSEKLVRWLLDHRIRPMIAHPERNKEIMRGVDKLRPFVEMGCLFQVTAGSVAGTFGRPARAIAFQLLEQGIVSALASDAHNLAHRPPDLEPGRAAAAHIIGDDAAWRLVRDNPMRLAASQFA